MKFNIRLLFGSFHILLFIFCQPGKGISQKKHVSAQEVADYIVALEIEHPEIVLRQAIMETGWFKSHHATRNNNLFGFRSHGPYFRFKTWKESVEYYKKWQDKKYTNKKENYYEFLNRIKYAGSKDYVMDLKKISLKGITISEKEF